MICLRLKPIIHISCCLAAIIACGPLKADPEEAGEEASTSQTEVSKTAELKMHAALGAAGFSKFAAAIEAAGLVDVLDEEGPFTCFAPTNEAFEKMPDETKKLLKENPASDEAKKWIKYHFVVGAAVKHEHLMLTAGLRTFTNKPLRVWVTPGKITMNRICEITRFDIEAANGVIHEVSRVLDADDEPKVNHIKPR